MLTCYNVDTLRCYDVTNPTAMVLNEAFGEGGVVRFPDLSGSQRDAGYIAVDVDGSIYVTCLKKDGGPAKGSHVLKISADGRSVIAETAVNEAYGICTAGDYLFVSTYAGENSEVHALNREDLSEVARYSREGQDYPLTSIAYGGGHLYVADQGAEMKGDSGSVLRTKNALSLTRSPAETEKVDPGQYEVPPTEEPAETEGTSGDTDGSGTKKNGRTALIIAAAVLAAAAAAAVIMLVRKKKAAE